ncbi:hypothetical protein Fot_28608 [Forsythia ovata]|uniref:Uncharacterized protein n=1 Tax=Forsythia ovata TaxID=205694 RepID=A0ABD1TPK8_9LAMI
MSSAPTFGSLSECSCERVLPSELEVGCKPSMLAALLISGHSGGSRFGVLADPTLDIVQCSTVVSSTTLVSTISQTQQTVGPDSRHVGPTIDFSHSIHMGPSLEAPLPAGPSHLSTAPSYISSLLPTPILSVSQSLDVSRLVDPAISHVGPTSDLLQTSAFAYDYSLHDRLLTIAGPTGSLPLAVDHYAESRSVIDPVYGSSLHDRLAISVGPTSTLAHSEFFDPLLDHMLAAPRAGVLPATCGVRMSWRSSLGSVLTRQGQSRPICVTYVNKGLALVNDKTDAVELGELEREIETETLQMEE